MHSYFELTCTSAPHALGLHYLRAREASDMGRLAAVAIPSGSGCLPPHPVRLSTPPELGAEVRPARAHIRILDFGRAIHVVVVVVVDVLVYCP